MEILSLFENDMPDIATLLSIITAPHHDGMHIAMKAGSLRLVALLFKQQYPCDAQSCDIAARKGFLECLKCAHSHGAIMTAQTACEAARGGKLEVLQYVLEQGCPVDTRVATAAAKAGNLAMLQYAHEHGCPWNSSVYDKAAAGGHLHILQYAHENGCPKPWVSYACCGAAAGGHLECLKYLHQIGFLGLEPTAVATAAHCQLECLQYACEAGCHMDAAVCAVPAAYHQQHPHMPKERVVACVKYALAHDCPFYVSDKDEWREFTEKHGLPDVTADFAAAEFRAAAAQDIQSDGFPAFVRI